LLFLERGMLAQW